MFLKAALPIFAASLAQAVFADQADCGAWLDASFWETATVSAVDTCIAKGFRVDARSATGRTPLHLAVEYRRSSSVLRTLLQHGADPALTDEKGETALHVAASSAVDASVPLTLVLWGAEVEAAVPGDTCSWPRRVCATRPLHLAARRPDGVDIVAALLVAGSDADAPDEEGLRALHYASAIAATDTVSVLLRAGATADAQDFQGETALHVAARQKEGVADLIALLLAQGLSPDTQDDEDGVTPLILGARYSQNPEAVHLLLKASKDPCYADEKGRTALMMWDDNEKLARDPSYWALHEECGRKGE